MKQKQIVLNLFKGSRGGRRPNSGRKRIHSKGVAHRSRPQVSLRTPLHINFKFKKNVKNKDSLRLLKRAIIKARSHGLRVIHYSLQSNHVHFIIEAHDKAVLTKGMRSLTITFAKGMKEGRIQVERYHLHVLKGLKETKNAVMYVLFNQQKHEKGIYSKVDGYSSLLSMKNAFKLISRFSSNRQCTIKIINSEFWKGDNPSGYVLKRTIDELTS